MAAGRKFTKEFKEAVARRVESGTPVKELARIHNLSADAVRQWRDEFREWGALAFARDGMQKFTKKFREAAVRRVEQGTPLKEVARSCRITPVLLRQWRYKFQTLGAQAFSDRKRRDKVVLIRLTEDEHKCLKVISKAEGARSISDFARSRLLGRRS